MIWDHVVYEIIFFPQQQTSPHLTLGIPTSKPPQGLSRVTVPLGTGSIRPRSWAPATWWKWRERRRSITLSEAVKSKTFQKVYRKSPLWRISGLQWRGIGPASSQGVVIFSSPELYFWSLVLSFCKLYTFSSSSPKLLGTKHPGWRGFKFVKIKATPFFKGR